MDEQSTPIELAERVSQLAHGLGIDTVLIGAYALAVYRFVRGTADIDLATCVQLEQLRQLREAVEQEGLRTELTSPDEDDPLGGVLRVWKLEDEEGDPIDPVEVVNYLNPYRPRRTPAPDALRHAIPMTGKPALRYPRLGDLIALKLYAGGDDSLVDVVKVLAENLDSDLDEVRTICKQYGYDQIDELIEKARTTKSKRR